MRTYSMSYREVLDMPIRAFWTVSGLVERLLVDEGRMTLEIASVAQDPDASKTLFERMEKQAPAPVKLSGHAMANMGAERDHAGFASLAALAG